MGNYPLPWVITTLWCMYLCGPSPGNDIAQYVHGYAVCFGHY